MAGSTPEAGTPASRAAVRVGRTRAIGRRDREEAAVNLNSIMIGSENPERLADYYTKLFGRPTWDDGGYVG